ncbi:SDR family NAD(P)-dependent oxidoreductase [Streptomyces sp. HUCO-GS316]|uniref:SDR family NAD(P)-dependent oxidoreductase n=1 Tax=Streptomyces sp. HUCO-GS316 TaxID=2692198 RepID=UPI003FA748FD
MRRYGDDATVRLQGRAAVVTGGTRVIGLAVARRPAAAGALVCGTARNADDVPRITEELGGVGLAGSVADPDHPARVTEPALHEFGRIDMVVDNAATNRPYGPLMEADPGARREAFAVNVEAPLRLGQSAWRAWLGEHGGPVVDICTEGAGHVGPNFVWEPGEREVASGLPLGRTGQPEDVARAVVWPGLGRGGAGDRGPIW